MVTPKGVPDFIERDRSGETVRAAFDHGEVSSPWGRALGREHLDTILLAKAADAGAEIFQPCAVAAIERTTEGFACRLTAGRASSPQPSSPEEEREKTPVHSLRTATQQADTLSSFGGEGRGAE